MRNLSIAILALTVILVSLFPNEYLGKNSKLDPIKSPHGADFKISCKTCHSTEGWIVDKKKFSFNHDETAMALIGQHAVTDCKLCHPTLVFSEANTECAQCHTDVHESTVGKECSRCHTAYSWLANNITQIHQQSRFPLVGVHATVDCYQCHTSETFQRFEVIGTECYSCHSEEYAATTQPNHVTAGYSTQCDECHTLFAKEWTGTGFNHNFFPLTQGHDVDECLKCHVNGNYAITSSECISCHQADYNAATNPNHLSANYSTNCTMCHTTAPGWTPAIFDHNQFPLTQGHNITDCSKCHVNGNYTNTSSECISCHQTDYNSTTNPNHLSANYSTNCTLCHTTAPGWTPATFDHSKFPLTKGHDIDDCSKCHINGNYSNTSNDCSSCHQADYNTTTNPSHSSLGFSTNCTECHTTDPDWKPASYKQHDALSFPIYSGKHQGEWNNCTDCHTNPGNYKVFTCIDCHEHNKTDMDNKHREEGGYVYNSVNCKNCHPQGKAD
jgi:predicted CXXCH cytochrome family protein